MKVYPNPSGGRFTVRASGPGTVDAALQLFNENGKLLQQKKASAKMVTLSFAFDLSNQPSGVYFVKLISKNGIQTAKVIVQR